MGHALSIGLALALCAGVAINASAPTAALAAEQRYKPPHNRAGQPDLTGNWSNANLTPLTREAGFGLRAIYTAAEVKEREGIQAANVEDSNKPIDNTKPLTGGVVTAHGGVGAVGNEDRQFLDPGSVVMRVHGEARNSLITTPDGQIPARKPGAPPAPRRGHGEIAADRSNGLYDNPEQLAIDERCILGLHRSAGPPIFPNGYYNQNYQIVQGRDAVAINIEMVHDTRIIRLTGGHRTDGLRPYFGDSIGHYEGDTLVVETTNIPEAQHLYGSWQTLKVTERFTRVAKDRLLYQFRVEDPTIWEKPWGGEYEFSTLNGRLMEYACHEGNYGMEGILAGARQQDAAEATAKKTAAAPK